MWSCERTITTSTPASAIWAQYEDVATWPAWNPGFESVRLTGPFRTGTTGTVRAQGQGDAPFTLLDVVPGTAFVMETEVGGGVLARSSCSVTALPDGGSQVAHRTELIGDGAAAMGAAAGPMLTANLETGLKALASAA